MGNVHCSKPGCCCRLLGRPPPPMICGARCYGCTKCCMMPPERHVLLLGRSGVGKTHVLYRALGASAPKPEPTKGFTSTIRYDETNTQSYEFYDVSGTEVERVFWRTLYTNVSFNDVVYFIDPLEYRAAKDKISEDRAELHALLSEPELQDSQIIVYFNWKKMVTDAKDAELKKEEKAQIEKDILQDLELTGFRDYVKEVIDPNVKVGASDVESEAARKQKTEEFSKMAIDKIRQKREAEAAAKAAAEGKAAGKDGAGAAKAADAEKKKAADAAKKAAVDVTKLVPVPKMDRAVVIPISSEDQLFCNLGLNVKAKAEKQDAEDELADLI